MKNKIKLVELQFMLDKEAEYNVIFEDDDKAYYNISHRQLQEIADCHKDAIVVEINPSTNCLCVSFV